MRKIPKYDFRAVHRFMVVLCTTGEEGRKRGAQIKTRWLWMGIEDFMSYMNDPKRKTLGLRCIRFLQYVITSPLEVKNSLFQSSSQKKKERKKERKSYISKRLRKLKN